MTTEQKLIFWANAYNAALTGFLSVRATHYDFNAVPVGERDKIRQNCQNFADDALGALEKQAPTQEPRKNSGRDLVQSLHFGSIWQANDSLSPRAPESARRPFLKFAPEPP